jgi:hypothetical protein
MTGSISDNWILLALWLQPLFITLNHNTRSSTHFTITLHTNLLCPNLHSQFTAVAPSRTALVPIRFSTAHTLRYGTRKSSNLQVATSRVLLPAALNPTARNPNFLRLQLLTTRILNCCYLLRLTPFHCTALTHSLTAKSKSKLLYDWRFTANQFVLASSPLRPTTRFFFSAELLR